METIPPLEQYVVVATYPNENHNDCWNKKYSTPDVYGPYSNKKSAKEASRKIEDGNFGNNNDIWTYVKLLSHY